MKFLKKLLFAIMIAIPSLQLNGMEKARTAMLEGTEASDFQIFQFLSTVIQENPDLYLPTEVTRIIAINACNITKKLRADFDKKYRYRFLYPDCIFDFIRESLHHYSMSHTTIINILKIFLNCSGKPLSEIKDKWYKGKTVFDCLPSIINDNLRLDCTKIICRAAGDQAWDLITKRDKFCWTILHYFSLESYHTSSIKELLNTAPNLQEAWLLINARDLDGQTALGLAKLHEKTELIELFESYRPQ